jgi:endonuclease IV
MGCNGNGAKVGSITSKYEHFHEWKRLAEEDAGVVDMETLMKGMFTKNNNQWKAKPLTKEDADKFNAALLETGIKPVVAHTSYLINLASPDYVSVFYTTWAGKQMLIVTGISVLLGAWIMNRLSILRY